MKFSIGKQADQVLKIMIKHADFHDLGDSMRLRDIRTRISIALQKGNARMALMGVQLINSSHDEALSQPPHRAINQAERRRMQL